MNRARHSFNVHGYSQPSEYRFSHDSIELAQRAADWVRKASANDVRVLDLCAGCGVVGLELLKNLKRADRERIKALDFVEVQNIYETHFQANIEWTLSQIGDVPPTRWHGLNYRDLGSPFDARYDLVISNPPYFDREQGNLPPSEFKARCRFFVDSDFATMWQSIARVLKPAGEALILVRDLSDHGVDRGTHLDAATDGLGRWQLMEPIRGTQLVRFQRRELP